MYLFQVKKYYVTSRASYLVQNLDHINKVKLKEVGPVYTHLSHKMIGPRLAPIVCYHEILDLHHIESVTFPPLTNAVTYLNLGVVELMIKYPIQEHSMLVRVGLEPITLDC